MDRFIGPGFWTSRRGRVALALGCVYLLWGSTYLGIRVAVESIPPLLAAALRWLLAGGVMLGWSALREGRPAARPREWGRAALAGALLIVAGNGFVTWAETRVPSGVAALGVATVSLWMVLLDWLRPGGTRPGWRVLLGVLLGLAGVALLGGGGHVDAAGLLALLLAALGWSVGSLWLRGGRSTTPPLRATAMQMLAGGGMLLLLALILGEGAAVRGLAVTQRSILGVLYLAGAGSLAGYTLYQWLLRATSPAVVSTYACVNPVVAVALGWLLGGEAYGARTLLTALLIVASVALIIASRVRPSPATATARSAA